MGSGLWEGKWAGSKAEKMNKGRMREKLGKGKHLWRLRPSDKILPVGGLQRGPWRLRESTCMEDFLSVFPRERVPLFFKECWREI